VGIVNTNSTTHVSAYLQAYFWVPQMPYGMVDQLVIKSLFFTDVCFNFFCFFVRLVNRPATGVYDHGFYLLLCYGIYS